MLIRGKAVGVQDVITGDRWEWWCRSSGLVMGTCEGGIEIRSHNNRPARLMAVSCVRGIDSLHMTSFFGDM